MHPLRGVGIRIAAENRRERIERGLGSGRREAAGRVFPDSVCHHLVPQGRDDEGRNSFLHRGVVVVARPCADGDARRVSDDPRIAVVVGRSRFVRDIRLGKIERRVGAKFRRACDVVGENVGDLPRYLRFHDAGALRLERFEYLAGAVFDLEDPRRRIFDPVVREDAIRSGHLKERHLAAAEDQREPVAVGVLQRRDAHIARELDRILDAREVEDLYRGDVYRLRERFAEGEWPLEFRIEVYRRVAGRRIGEVVRRTAARELRLEVEDNRFRRVPFLQCGRIDERFERRPRLAMRERDVHLTVNRFIKISARAHHREYLPARGIHRDEPRIRCVEVLLIPERACGYHLLRFFLQVVVEGRDDMQSALRDGVGAVFFFEIFADKKDEMRSLDAGLRPVAELDHFGPRTPILFVRDERILEHLPQDKVFARVQFVAMIAVRGVARGRLRQGREVRRLCEVDILRIHAEEELARLLYAVNSAAVGGFVEVRVQYLVFRIDLFEPERKDDLLELAHDGLPLREERVLHHLLGDGRTALTEAAGRDIYHDRAHERKRPEALVLVERRVFYRYCRVAQVGRDLIERHGSAPHGAVHVVENDVPRAVVYLGGLRDFAVLKIIDGGDRSERRPQYRPADDDESDRNRAEHAELHPRGQFPPPLFNLSEHTSGHCIAFRRSRLTEV